MTSSVLFTVAVFLAVFGNQLAFGQLPIPRRQLGFVYKPLEASPSAKVTLSFYIDHTCIECLIVFPTMTQVADHFGPENLKLVTHLFPLPYYRNSYTIAKGAHVIDAFSKGAATYSWFKIIFDHRSELTTSATVNLTDVQVMDILAPLAEKVSGIPQAEFKSQMAERSIDSMTKLGWKYACSRGVYGAPTFMLNDVVVPADLSWTVETWIDKIKPLLA